MSGSPIEALKIGAQLIGEKYYELEPNQRPFEKFYTITYNSCTTSFCEDSYAAYNNKIKNIRAGGGTNFMNVFK